MCSVIVWACTLNQAFIIREASAFGKTKDTGASERCLLCVYCRLAEEREIVVYCDLHGHSRKQNVFIYGCENKGIPMRRLRERIFPVMLGRNAPDKVRRDVWTEGRKEDSNHYFS